MSRSNYTYDADGPEAILWRGAVQSAIRGARGQKLLRDMAAALDAMPKKELIGGDLVTDEAEVCALGCVALARGVSLQALAAVDSGDANQVAAMLHVAPALVREIAFENDEQFPGIAPEQRWARVRSWVNDNLAKAAAS